MQDIEELKPHAKPIPDNWLKEGYALAPVKSTSRPGVGFPGDSMKTNMFSDAVKTGASDFFSPHIKDAAEIIAGLRSPAV